MSSPDMLVRVKTSLRHQVMSCLDPDHGIVRSFEAVRIEPDGAVFDLPARLAEPLIADHPHYYRSPDQIDPPGWSTPRPVMAPLDAAEVGSPGPSPAEQFGGGDHDRDMAGSSPVTAYCPGSAGLDASPGETAGWVGTERQIGGGLDGQVSENGLDWPQEPSEELDDVAKRVEQLVMEQEPKQKRKPGRPPKSSSDNDKKGRERPGRVDNGRRL